MILHLILEVLFVIAVDAEILLLQDEQSVAQVAGLEVYQPLRIESKPLITGLEMKMRTGRASCGTSITDYISGIDPVSSLNKTF
jgi:hypothetical protein